MTRTMAAFALTLMLIPSLARSQSYGRPTLAPPRTDRNQALAELKQIGGVLVHYNDRLPGRPVIAVDFTNHPRFQESWLAHLNAFPHLATLGLGGVPLTDEGLRYVRGLSELDTLVLTGTKVTDAGLAELMNLKKLRFLDVRGTAVTEVGVSVLRRRLPELEVEVKASVERPVLPTVERYPPKRNTAAQPLVSVEKINQLRRKATELSQPVEGRPEPEGWSKSRVDPNRLVEIFAPLHLRKGHVLRAYVFREGGNGNGVVWAMPAEAEFPVPEDCPTLEYHMLKAPKPSEALDDAMEAVEGDGSPASYLAASLLRRELHEFGAAWHGCNWQTHVILGDDPWRAGAARADSPLDGPTSEAAEWKWQEPRPANWGPRVEVGDDQVTVTFHTYSGLGQEAIYRHTDTYRPGKYRPKTEQKRIATGPSGFAF